MRHSQILTITVKQPRPRSADPAVIYRVDRHPYWHWKPNELIKTNRALNRSGLKCAVLKTIPFDQPCGPPD
ncbi:hypothetical protein IMAU10062_00767 [Lactiplantibacillus plantarum]|nr:hypothetical protein [Lactiplantibacillus plantarum]